MKFIYRLFWTMSIMSWMLFLYILKNIQSTESEIACIFVGFFVVVSRLCYRYLNVILDEFCSIFCFAVSNRNDVFSSNADPSWLSFLRSPDE